MRLLGRDNAAEFLRERKLRSQNADAIVRPIIDAVEARGDDALREFAEKWDSLAGLHLQVSAKEITDAKTQLDPTLAQAIQIAAKNIREFAELQKPFEMEWRMDSGIMCGQLVRPIPSVGCYVPGGLYPLPSTLLMTVIPAQVAGVPKITICSPRPAATTLATAGLLDENTLFRVGGAHAIAAMAFGTETISKVDKIVGPGNAYVAAAKKLLSGTVAIDSVAGPTELVVVADEGNPEWIAADMIAQAEHDPQASSILITTNQTLASQVSNALEIQLENLSTADIARESLEKFGAIFIVDSEQEAADLVNELAPEHLCLHDPSMQKMIDNAGAIFLGPMSSESLGDYAAGPNHVLPTGGAARVRGGLSVLDYLKIITTIRASSDSVRNLAPTVATLARAEGLEGHARAVEIRL
ncbi:MAG: histidinol dehydrogenase [Armatimonadetes bacterium]|nr:histidinol dehydrogenase [Armatimonadota bacterium]